MRAHTVHTVPTYLLDHVQPQLRHLATEGGPQLILRK